MERYQKKIIPDNPLVRIVVASYLNGSKQRILAAKCFLYSVLCQTYENLEILLVHDGKIEDENIRNEFKNIDPKIKLIETEERKGNWGMFHRHFYATIEPFPDWILFTNDDNYYTPQAIELMLSCAYKNNSKMVLCDMIHSHWLWSYFETAPHSGRCDMGSFMTEFNLVRETEWDNFGFSADGEYVNKLAKKTNPVKFPKCLFVHN